MSYSFIRANKQYMLSGTVTARGSSYSAIAWVKHTADAGNSHYILNWFSAAAGNDYVQINLFDTAHNLYLERRTNTGPTSSSVGTSSPNPASDIWLMVHFRCGSATDNIVGFSGGNEVSDAVSIVPAASIDQIIVGGRNASDTSGSYGGKISMLALYNNYKLTTGDLAALLTMQPSDHAGSYANCLAYYDMRVQDGTGINPVSGQINDQKNSNHITLGGTTGLPTFSAGDDPSFVLSTGRMLLTGIG